MCVFNINSFIKIVFLLTLAFSIGCNEFEVNQPTDEPGIEVGDPSVDKEVQEFSKGVLALDEDYLDVELDISKIENELDKLSLITIIGQVRKKNRESEGVNAKGLSFGLAKKLKTSLSKVTNKLGVMADKLDDLEAKILLKIANLDPIVQVVLYEKLQKLLLKLEDMRNKVAAALDKFEEKVGEFIDKVDKMLRKLDFSNPLHIIAYSAILEIRDVLVDFKKDLAKL